MLIFLEIIAEIEQKLIKEHPSVWNNEFKDVNKDDYTTFREHWYTYSITHSNKDFSVILSLVDSPILIGNEMITKMCAEYLYGLEWSYRYINEGFESISIGWSFGYNQSPLLSDVVKVLSALINTDSLPNTKSIVLPHIYPNVVHQLVAITPPDQIEFYLPEEVMLLTRTNSPIVETFMYDVMINRIAGISRAVMPDFNLEHIIVVANMITIFSEERMKIFKERGFIPLINKRTKQKFEVGRLTRSLNTRPKYDPRSRKRFVNQENERKIIKDVVNMMFYIMPDKNVFLSVIGMIMPMNDINVFWENEKIREFTIYADKNISEKATDYIQSLPNVLDKNIAILEHLNISEYDRIPQLNGVIYFNNLYQVTSYIKSIDDKADLFILRVSKRYKFNTKGMENYDIFRLTDLDVSSDGHDFIFVSVKPIDTKILAQWKGVDIIRTKRTDKIELKSEDTENPVKISPSIDFEEVKIQTPQTRKIRSSHSIALEKERMLLPPSDISPHRKKISNEINEIITYVLNLLLTQPNPDDKKNMGEIDIIEVYTGDGQNTITLLKDERIKHVKIHGNKQKLLRTFTSRNVNINKLEFSDEFESEKISGSNIRANIVVIDRERTNINEFKRAYSRYKWAKNSDYVVAGGDTTMYEYYKVPEDVSGSDVEVLWYWNKVDDKLIIIANGVLVRSTPIPYMHKELPFSRFVGVVKPHYFCGRGFPEMVKDTQEEINTFRNMIIDQGKLNIYKMFLVSTRLDLDDEDLIPAPSKHIPVDNEAGESVNSYIQPLEYGGLKPELFNIIEKLEDNAKRQTGIDDRLQSVPTGGTATEQAILKESSLKRIRLILKSNQWGALTRTGRLRLSNIQQFYTQKRVEKITGEDGTISYEEQQMSIPLEGVEIKTDNNIPRVVRIDGYSIWTVDPKLIRSSCDVRVDIEPMLYISKPMQQTKINEAVQVLNAMFPDFTDREKLFEHYIRIHELPPDIKKSSMESEMPDMIKLANLENDEMIKGNPIPPTRGATTEHTQTHLQFAKELGDSFSDEVKKIFGYHVVEEAKRADIEDRRTPEIPGGIVPQGEEGAPSPGMSLGGSPGGAPQPAPVGPNVPATSMSKQNVGRPPMAARDAVPLRNQGRVNI